MKSLQRSISQMSMAMHDQEMRRNIEMAGLKAKVDLLFQAKVKSGEITADMVAAADITEDVKAALTTQVTETLAAVEAEAVKT